MQIIQLTNGDSTRVSDTRYEFLIRWNNWYALFNSKTYYAHRHDLNTSNKAVIQMHRAILEHAGFNMYGLIIDHRDGNGLNNLDSNLRIANRSQNAANPGPTIINQSGYKGVSWHKRCKKWTAQIGYNYEKRHLGYFSHPADATQAYNSMAFELFGDFAWLNEI